MQDAIAALANKGLAALRSGDVSTARRSFDAVVEAGRASAGLFVMLADTCSRQGDDPAANAALDRAVALEPRNLAALTMRGDRAAAAGDDRAAAAWYGMVLSSAQQLGEIPAEARPLIVRAQSGVASAQTRFDAHLTAAVGGLDSGPRFAEALAILSGQAEPQLQAPTSFYYPGLPQTAFYESGIIDWVSALEAATPELTAELEAVMATREVFRPYVEADPTRPNKGHALLDSDDWSAFHLYEGGEPVAANAVRCPATMAALGKVPLPHIAGRSPMALFSLLAPHTHIPPHHGMLNTRLIVHLPLIVPPDCRLRVGNHTRRVEAGRAIIFDDSILHEAWNDSDDTRVVLLFEIWNPALSYAERHALTQMFGAIGDYR